MSQGLDDVLLLVHTETQFCDSALQSTLHRTIRPDATELACQPFPMAQQFVSRLLTLGATKEPRTPE